MTQDFTLQPTPGPHDDRGKASPYNVEGESHFSDCPARELFR